MCSRHHSLWVRQGNFPQHRGDLRGHEWLWWNSSNRPGRIWKCVLWCYWREGISLPSFTMYISSRFLNKNIYVKIQEVAIKKMRSNSSKEFLAEIKVLCKIHHINVVSKNFNLLTIFWKKKKMDSLLIWLRFRWSWWDMLVVKTTSTWFMSLSQKGLSVITSMIHWWKVFKYNFLLLICSLEKKWKSFYLWSKIWIRPSASVMECKNTGCTWCCKGHWVHPWPHEITIRASWHKNDQHLAGWRA